MLSELAFSFTDSLLNEQQLASLQSLLQEHLATWCTSLHAFEGSHRAERIPIDGTNSLRDALQNRTLTESMDIRANHEFSYESTPKRFGVAEFRGSNLSVIMVLLFDERRTPWLSNSASFQVFRRHIDKVRHSEWAKSFMLSGAEVLQVRHIRYCESSEFESKNMDFSQGVRAIGPRQLALPGIYWANFLGAPYCDLIGRDRLLAAPAYEMREVGKGVLILMSDKPEDWNTPDYKAREQRVLDHIGREYVFERDNPDKPLKSPYALPDLPPHDPSKDIHVLHKGGGKYEVLNDDLREMEGLPPLDEKTKGRFGLPTNGKKRAVGKRPRPESE